MQSILDTIPSPFKEHLYDNREVNALSQSLGRREDELSDMLFFAAVLLILAN